MRRFLSLAAVLALAACGGGGGSAPSSPPPPVQTTAPANGPTITPQFLIVVPPKGTSSVGKRQPKFVSSAALSITITLTSVGGNPPNVTPTSVTTNISGSSCTVATPCAVNGPPSPPGQADTYSLVTYDAAGGTGNQLDRATVTFTPTVGTQNSVNVTLLGIPFTVTISGVPAAFQANTAGQTADLTVTVADHAGQTITGTYASPVTISDPDTETTNGTKLTCTPPNTGATCVATLNAGVSSSVTIADNTNGARLNYGGLAENPVTLTSSNSDVTANSGTAGSGTFTPLLNAITSDGTNSTTLSGGGVGIDLFTNDSGSPSGYTGTVKYGELGFTNSPYNKVLTTNPTGSTGACSTFASLATGANTGGETPFTATAIASPAAGICTVTVTDSLTDQTNPLPTFKVTYTTSVVNGSSKKRQ